MIERTTVPPFVYKTTTLKNGVCVQTEVTRSPSGFGAATWYNDGEAYICHSKVMKSDHVKATPWAFSKTEYVNEGWTFKSELRTQHAPTREKCGEYVYKADLDGTFLSACPAIGEYIVPLSTREMVDSMSILKAQASLRKSLANIPMLYAERKASVKTIGLYSRAILNNVITMQRRDVKKWLKALKRHKSHPEKLKRIAQDIANRHLEFVFGVLPLIEDIKGLCEFVGSDKIAIRTGRGRHTQMSVSEQSTRWRGNQPVFGYESTVTQTQRYSVRTGLRCDVDTTILNDASKLGFNPIYAWYDMTPLSFVVGWFSNLNLWLQSLDATPGLTYRTGYSSKRAETSVTKEVVMSQNPSYPSAYVEGTGKGSARVLNQTRVIHEDMPGLQSLRFIDNMSVFAAVASVALAVQRLVKTADREISNKPFRYRGPRPKNLPPINYRRV